MFRWTKRIVLSALALGLVGGICFGSGLFSYVRSSSRMLKTAVKDSIPVEFEIQRARDLLEDLIPEVQANLRLVAAEEVDVANLEKEIEKERQSAAQEKDKIHVLRSALQTEKVSYTFGQREYKRSNVVEELARRFEHLKTAQMLLSGKEDLLKNRRRSLDAALEKLEKTRLARIQLAAQIEALEGQFRLVQAQSAGSEFHLDQSRLAQTERVIAELKKRLEVAQRVLAREAKFVELIPIETESESRLVERVDAYFAGKGEGLANAPEAADAAR
jgi:hypothetical protein